MSVVSGRTRWMLAAGGAVAGVAVITGAVAAGSVATPSPSYDVAGAPPAAATGMSAPEASPLAAPAAGVPSAPPAPAAAPAPRPAGGVIRSGMDARKGEWVFYAFPMSNRELPNTTFGVMAARRLPTGKIVDMVSVNESQGSSTSPGFHAVEGAMEVEGEPTPAFGYYSGPAARITATVQGRTVTAEQATWSRNRSIVIFWFDLEDLHTKATHSKKDAGDPSSIPAGLKAFDKAGKALPTGNATVAFG